MYPLNISFIFLVALSFLASISPVAFSNPLESLKSRLEKVASLSVSYDLERRLEPHLLESEGLSADEAILNKKVSFLISSEKLRVDIKHLDSGHSDHIAFNGKTYQCFLGSKKTMVACDEFPEEIATTMGLDGYFDCFGFLSKQSDASFSYFLKPSTIFGSAPWSSLAEYKWEKSLVNGKPCWSGTAPTSMHLLRRSIRMRIVLDQELGNFPVIFERLDDQNNVLTRASSSDFTKFAMEKIEISLPRLVTTVVYYPSGELARTIHHRVTKLEVNQPLENHLFEIDPASADKIFDKKTNTIIKLNE